MTSESSGKVRILLSPFLRKIVGTALTSVLTVACLVVMTRFLAQGLGPEGFGAISLVRRILSTLEPLVTLGASISIARFVALSQNSQDALNYTRTGFLLVFLATGLVAWLSYFFSQPLTVLVFGSSSYHPLFLSLLVLIATYSIYITLYSYYRGVGNMLLANVWQITVIGIGPMVFAMVCRGSDQATVITYLMAAILGVALFPLLKELKLLSLQKDDLDSIRAKTSQMFRYGWARIPGGLLFGGMLTIGPILAPHVSNLKDAGYLVVGQSIFKIVEAGFEAFGRVALPAMAAILGAHGKLALRERVSDLVGMIFDLGTYSTFHALIWIDLLVSLWLGPQYKDAAFLVQIMALSLAPYLAFATLRSVFDAIEEKAITTRYLAVSFVLTVLVSLLLIGSGYGAVSLALGSTLGFMLLGTLAVYRIAKDFNFELKRSFRFQSLLFNIALGLAALSLRSGIHNRFPGSLVFQAASALFCEAVLFSSLLLFLNYIRAEWIVSVKKRVFVRA